MEQIDFSNIPYSQHHREAAMMLGGPVNMSVFTYLLDEYLFRLRTGKNTTFKLSQSKISETQCISRNTVKKVIQQLEVMGLINVDGGNVSINGDVYTSLIYTFHNLQNKEQKLKFAEYLQTAQICALKDMGYVQTAQNCAVLTAMSGSVLETAQNLVVGMLKNEQSDKTAQICAPKLLKNEQVGNNQTAQNCAVSKLYAQFCAVFNDRNEATAQICAVLGIQQDSNETKELISVLFGEKGDISTESKLLIFEQVMPKILLNFEQLPAQICAPEINNNKYKKIKYQDSSSFQDDFENFEQDDDEQDFVTLKKGGSHFKKKSFPYFPVSEIKEIISDIHNCLDNDCKLYLWNFNQELHSRYDQDEEFDEENGEVTRQASTDDSQFVIQEIDFTDMQNRAFDATQEMIETGFTFDEHDNKLEVTAIMDNPDRLEGIIDWPLNSIGDVGKCCKVDWSRIQNPDEEEIQEVKSVSRTRRTKEGEVNKEREDNKKYISAILDNASDDETWESLSPMEKLVYNFLCEYFKFKDDSNEIEDIGEQPYLNRNVLFQFIQQEKEKRPDTPTQQEFVATFAKDKLDIYGGIHLRPMMFSAAKITNWNKKHGFQSVI